MNKYLIQVENLKKRALEQCSEHGFEYENLLLSEVLESCECYLRHVLRTAPVIRTGIGLSYLKIPLDVELVNLCTAALPDRLVLLERIRTPKTKYDSVRVVRDQKCPCGCQ